jgi:choline kinase
MKAVILNSGTGSRMGHLTESRPKCLVEIREDETILSRQIRQILGFGIRDFVITTGQYTGMIQEYVRAHFPVAAVTYVHNPQYATTNYIYSMDLAGPLLRDDIVLMHGDIVTTDSVLRSLMNVEVPDAAVIDSAAVLPEEDFKGRIRNGLVTEIGVNVTGSDCVSLLPLYKLSKRFMDIWMDEIHAFVENGLKTVYAEDAFNSRVSDVQLYTVDTWGRLCMEVDTAEDLARASELIRRAEHGTD